MYREEFTRQWHEDQFRPEPPRQYPQQYSGQRPQYNQRNSQYNLPGGDNYLANASPLPIQRQSGLYGPAVRRNPLLNNHEETSFMGNGHGRRSMAVSENFGLDNPGYIKNDNRRRDFNPYYSSSAAGDRRGDNMYIYRGKTISEPGIRPAMSEISVAPLEPDEDYRNDYKRQSRSMAGSEYTRNSRYLAESEYKSAPSWVKVLDPVYAEPDTERRKSGVSENNEKNGSSLSGFIAIRIIIICLVIWDLVNDWLLASSGPIQFLGTSSDNDNEKCVANNKVLHHTFKMNISEINTSMCSNTNDIWTLAAVFSLLGSLLAILQVINMVMEIVKKRRPQFFQILQGHSEICFVMFFEELPQCLLFTIYFFICDCSELNQGAKTVNLFSLLATVSSAAAMTLRYASSFDTVASENGCCNLWWRCCCCRNTEYCCRLHPKECCCMCDVPCPLCCCTLGCKMCQYTPKTWCASLLKAFKCFCGCCATEDDSYGVRMMNNFSLFILWTCLAFQILIYHSIVV